MTLSAHLLDRLHQNSPAMMPPPNAPQTPHTPQTPNNNFRSHFQATPAVLTGYDSSQWGMHHGSPAPWGGTPAPMPSMGTRFTSWSEERVSTMQARLARKLGPEYVTQRPGPGGGPKLSYIEGWKVVNLANDVFGFNGWSSTIVSLKTDFLDVNAQDRCFVGITAIIRITLQDGCHHEDLGYGHAENIKGKAAALEKKEAVTDGIKRALKHFGNVLGNCLYDREFTKEVSKIRVAPVKMNVNELERRPEFAPPPPPEASRAASAVPPHVTGNRKPPAPAPAVVPAPVAAAGAPLPALGLPPDTPLRSIDDEDMFFDDTEGEFGFMEEDSAFQEIDESMLDAQVVPPALESKPATDVAPAAPAYQHRHRPNLQPLGQSARSVHSGPSSVSPEGTVPVTPEHPLQAANGRAFVTPEAGADGVRRDSVSSDTSFGAKSAGSADRPLAKGRVGGFALPGAAQNSASASAAARAAAIKQSMAEFSASTSISSTSMRAEAQPGGMANCVVSRASASVHMRAQSMGASGGGGAYVSDMDSENDLDSPSSNRHSFISARGVKRNGSSSPTKADQGHGDRVRPGGPRSALNEIPNASDEWAKRSRVM